MMAARLTGTGLAILLALASPALAREGAPNVVEGHPTNAFMPGFPETIDGLVRESIQSKPAEGRIVANYRAPDDNRLVQMLLYALYDGDIARNVERAEAYMADGEIPVTRASVTSPAGRKMECLTTRVDDQGHTLCVAEILGRALNVQVSDVVAADADTIPDDKIAAAHDLAGRMVDSVSEAPEG